MRKYTLKTHEVGRKQSPPL